MTVRGAGDKLLNKFIDALITVAAISLVAYFAKFTTLPEKVDKIGEALANEKVDRAAADERNEKRLNANDEQHKVIMNDHAEFARRLNGKDHR